MSGGISKPPSHLKHLVESKKENLEAPRKMTEKQIRLEKSLGLAKMVTKALSSKDLKKETYPQEEKEAVKMIVKELEEGNLDIVKETFWMLTSRLTTDALCLENCGIFAWATANGHGEILKLIVPLGSKNRLNQRLTENDGKLLEDFISNELKKEKNGTYNKTQEIERIECLKMLLSVSPALMHIRFTKNDINENMKECFCQALTKLINEPKDPRKSQFMEILRPGEFYLTD